MPKGEGGMVYEMGAGKIVERRRGTLVSRVHIPHANKRRGGGGPGRQG